MRTEHIEVQDEDDSGWVHISVVAKKLWADIQAGKIHANISPSNNYFQNLRAIAEYYSKNIDDILAHHRKGNRGFYRAYPCDWRSILSPIEFDAWCAIRCKGGMALYPQFPVGRYFLDFGNPHLKIGVELDGKAYHDADKDLIRDTSLRTMGWKIFRITGKEMSRTKFEDWNELDEDFFEYSNDIGFLENWILNTGDGILEAIKTMYFKGNIYLPESYHQQFRDLCFKSLSLHNLLGYEI